MDAALERQSSGKRRLEFSTGAMESRGWTLVENENRKLIKRARRVDALRRLTSLRLRSLAITGTYNSLNRGIADLA
ncbi:hypothetical protein SAMN05444169_4958 [Bradyrhizobium erythrophlei]|jgi:hypothetical protein|uniref:Uncharacterized protein n=1 Tax=Bradyrhizobium erythrophlei TaxID=1437360 RepID=A0A1M5P174_9BRAD|nr:hypothetical protein SAMN05444169_4958 [Bradyrhizobium erythrophlei]